MNASDVDVSGSPLRYPNAKSGDSGVSPALNNNPCGSCEGILCCRYLQMPACEFQCTYPCTITSCWGCITSLGYNL